MTRAEILAMVRTLTLIESTNVSDADIVILINQGIHEVSVVTDWAFLEASATISLVADDRDYALPADYDRFLALVDDDNDGTLEFVAPSTWLNFVGNDTGNSNTSPDYFTIFEGELLLSPVPSTADTNRLTLYYYKKPTELTLTTTEPEWHQAFHMVLVEYCKWKLWEREEYFDQSERSFIAYARYLEGMRSWYATKGRQTPMIWGEGSGRRRGDPNLYGFMI